MLDALVFYFLFGCYSIFLLDRSLCCFLFVFFSCDFFSCLRCTSCFSARILVFRLCVVWMWFWNNSLALAFVAQGVRIFFFCLHRRRSLFYYLISIDLFTPSPICSYLPDAGVCSACVLKCRVCAVGWCGRRRSSQFLNSQV